MKNKFKMIGLLLLVFNSSSYSQDNAPYTASFVGLMGVDTVLIETYTMVNNHLYGKAFIRVPEDYIGEFSIHFYPDGSIREFNINAMDPFNSSLPFQAKSGAFEYRLNMNCDNDTCTYYNSEKNRNSETIFKHKTNKMDFVGGWVPLISLMEWNSMRLVKSKKEKLPLNMINHNIGVYEIGVEFQNRDTIIFGGPFLEYTKIQVNEAGRILSTNGMGTPWNYHVSKQPALNIDEVAKRMAKTPGIGIPSPTETIQKTIHNSNVSLTYGRPYKRGRKIFGGVVPLDSLWRTGANGPTTLRIPKDLKAGKTRIPKGEYSLYTIPKNKEWVLIMNTDINRWPTDPDRSKDVVQLSMPIEKTSDIREQFTIEIIETVKGFQLQFSWDARRAVAQFDFVEE